MTRVGHGNVAILAMLGIALFAAVSAAACGDPVALGGFDDPDSGMPGLVGDGGETVPDASESSSRALCIATDCPVPYGTCPDDAFRCQTNFDSDNDNCGACGITCPHGEDARKVFGAEWFCQSGECRMSCSADKTKHTADCNHDVADGCEIDLQCDANNCGGCGIACPAGLPCILGSCGCPAGLTSCDDTRCGAECLDLSTDDLNCGTCGNLCPESADPAPTNMRYGCADSTCGKLKCEGGFKDCNDDLEDGCEISIYDDTANCGGCGIACAPGQFCEYGTCKCSAAETLCVSSFGFSYCANLDNDRSDCGACENQCPFAEYPATTVCRLGRCEIECAPGYADCDGLASNGCETFVNADPNNCGACGVKCDLSLGQPCVQGTCLVEPCEGGPTR